MLKKKLLSLSVLAVLMFAGFQSQAQNVVIKINPLSLFVITGNVQAEYAFNEKMSAQLGFYIGSINLGFGASGTDGGVNYTWYGVTPEFRYYVTNKTKEAPRGFYVAPFLRYSKVSYDFTGSVTDPDNGLNTTASIGADVNSIGGGVSLGYQWLFGDVFALDLFFGPQYRSSSTTFTATCDGCDGDETVVDTSVGLNFGGIGIRTGIAIGVAF